MFFLYTLLKHIMLWQWMSAFFLSDCAQIGSDEPQKCNNKKCLSVGIFCPSVREVAVIDLAR